MDLTDQLELKIKDGFLTTRQRIIFEGAVYHVTQHAPGREPLFLEEGDYLYFLKEIKSIAKSFSLTIHSFVLMPNHLHLLFGIQNKNLSQAMKCLFGGYAEYFNKKYERRGHVFCGRFRASVCYDDLYFLSISVYIHLNPVRAGLCRVFSEYRWSSIGVYIEDKRSFVNSEKILLSLHEDLSEARTIYKTILRSIQDKGEVTSAKDRKSMKESIQTCFRIAKRLMNKEDDGGFIECIEKSRNTRNPKTIEARKYALEQLIANGWTMEDIIKTFSMSRSTVYRLLK